MTFTSHTGDGTNPKHASGAPSGSAVTVEISETKGTIGSSPAAAQGASTMRISDYVRHEWSGTGSCQERIMEECRGAWMRWVAALTARTPDLSWTEGGFGPAAITCNEKKEPNGEGFCTCVVDLRCWAEYEASGKGRMSEVRPALTPEEWRAYAPVDRSLAQYAPALASDNAHGAAALALHGQAHGFTWDDYYELVDLAHEIEQDHGPPEFLLPEPKRQIDALRSLAARIAALLPPRDSESQT